MLGKRDGSRGEEKERSGGKTKPADKGGVGGLPKAGMGRWRNPGNTCGWRGSGGVKGKSNTSIVRNTKVVDENRRGIKLPKIWQHIRPIKGGAQGWSQARGEDAIQKGGGGIRESRERLRNSIIREQKKKESEGLFRFSSEINGERSG